jgi:tetratricopeptide (TPR) repeat protein
MHAWKQHLARLAPARLARRCDRVPWHLPCCGVGIPRAVGFLWLAAIANWAPTSAGLPPDSVPPGLEPTGGGADLPAGLVATEQLVRAAAEAAQLTAAGHWPAAERKLGEILEQLPADHWQHAWLQIQLAQLQRVRSQADRGLPAPGAEGEPDLTAPAADRQDVWWQHLQPLADPLLAVLASQPENGFDSRAAARGLLQLVELADSPTARPQQLALLDRLMRQGCPSHCRAAALLRRGQLLLLDGDPDAARFDLQQLLEQPGLSAADALLGRYLLAESLYQVAAWDDAAEHWEWLVERGVAEPAAGWLQLARLRLAEWHVSRQRWGEAARLLEPLLGTEPLERLAMPLPAAVVAEALYLQARCLISQAELESARNYLRAAESQLTGTQVAQASRIGWLIGETYMLQSDYPAALSAYWEVLELDGGDPRWRAAAMLQASRCQQALGRPERAEQICRRLLEELPASPFAVEARRWLAELSETKATARLADDRYKEGREAIR